MRCPCSEMQAEIDRAQTNRAKKNMPRLPPRWRYTYVNEDSPASSGCHVRRLSITFTDRRRRAPAQGSLTNAQSTGAQREPGPLCSAAGLYQFRNS